MPTPAQVPARYGLAAALRTELFAHTASGCVYVYDPAARTVEQVLGGVAGASALALSADGEILYAADLAGRCVWAVPTTGRELTAGGKGCAVFAQGLPGYPGALAVEEDGTVDIRLPLGKAGLAGRPRRRHPAARRGPPPERIHAGKAGLPARQRHQR